LGIFKAKIAVHRTRIWRELFDIIKKFDISPSDLEILFPNSKVSSNIQQLRREVFHETKQFVCDFQTKESKTKKPKYNTK